MGALLRLMRPHQWLKNGFVFLGLFFTHSWSDSDLVFAVVLAASGFSLISSSIYIINDYFDREKDRLHPVKRNRPLAAGTVSITAAMVTALLSLVTGLALSYLASPLVLVIVIVYLLMNIAYSWRLKEVVILDVFIIAAGFMLRIIAGTSGVDIPPSSWLLLTGMMVTLFLGFTKRRAEYALLSHDPESARKVLKNYSQGMLDIMIAICGAGVVVAYSLYTVSPETVELHQTDKLIYTLPFILYGLFRYLFLTYNERAGEDPARDLIKDVPLLVTVVGWMGVTLWLIL